MDDGTHELLKKIYRAPTLWDARELAERQTAAIEAAKEFRKEQFCEQLTDEAHDEWLAIRACTSSPLQAKLFAIWHMMGEELLTEEGALKTLTQIVEEGLPRKKQALSCETCQRHYGLVDVREGSTVKAFCVGCVREGRV